MQTRARRSPDDSTPPRISRRGRRPSRSLRPVNEVHLHGAGTGRRREGKDRNSSSEATAFFRRDSGALDRARTHGDAFAVRASELPADCGAIGASASSAAASYDLPAIMASPVAATATRRAIGRTARDRDAAGARRKGKALLVDEPGGDRRDCPDYRRTHGSGNSRCSNNGLLFPFAATTSGRGSWMFTRERSGHPTVDRDVDPLRSRGSADRRVHRPSAHLEQIHRCRR